MISSINAKFGYNIKYKCQVLANIIVTAYCYIDGYDNISYDKYDFGMECV